MNESYVWKLLKRKMLRNNFYAERIDRVNMPDIFFAAKCTGVTFDGWIELKVKKNMSTVKTKPIKIYHYTPGQKAMAKRMMNFGINYYMLLCVIFAKKQAKDWILLANEEVLKLDTLPYYRLITQCSGYWRHTFKESQFREALFMGRNMHTSMM